MQEICYRIHRNFPVFPKGAASTNGDTTSLIDIANLSYAGADIDLLERAWLYFPEAAAADRKRIIAAGGFNGGAGDITFAPATAAGVTNSGKLYGIWRDLDPSFVEAYIEEELRGMRFDQWVPISDVVDADAEAGDEDDWSGTNATLSRNVVAAEVRHGKQSLDIVANAGVPQVEMTVAIPVTVNQHWLVSAMVYVNVGTITMEARDATAGAVIGSGATHAEVGRFLELVPSPDLVSIPASCKLLNLRFAAAGATDDFRIDDIFAWNRDNKVWEPPSWLNDPHDIVRIGYYPRGRQISAGLYAYEPDERRWEPYPFRTRSVEEDGLHAFKVELTGRGPIKRPLWAVLQRPYDPTATTIYTDQELFTQLILHRCYEHLIETALNDGAKADYIRRKAELEESAVLRSTITRHGQDVLRVHAPRLGSF